MSKNVKIILIVAGILIFLGVVCVAGAGFLGYYFVDTKGIEKSRQDGAEFGRTTDNAGCQTKAAALLEPVRETQIGEILKVQYFFGGCLENSRSTPNFCDGLPTDLKDIMNGDQAKEAECRKLGIDNSNACRQVMKKKLDFCEKKR